MLIIFTKKSECVEEISSYDSSFLSSAYYKSLASKIIKISNTIINRIKPPKVAKIGIVTITNNSLGNYGNTLQNYAVQAVLDKFGYQCETIRNLWYIEQRRFKWAYAIKLKIAKNYNSKKNQKFEQFRKKYIKDSKQYIGRGHENYQLLNKTYDKFICGSDQVWNPTYRLNDNLYFNLLEFASPDKRIAYAVSIGISVLPKEVEDQYRKALSQFKAISVREDSAASIVECLIQKKPIVLIDPTMMVTSEEWLQISKSVKRLEDKRYILKYCLGDTTPIIEDTCMKLKLMFSAEIVDITDKNADSIYGPDEFIWLVKNAEYIVTDSYHGTIFSMLFNKQFSVFKRTGADSLIFSRLETLLGIFDLEDRIITNKTEELKTDMYDISSTLSAEREKAYHFLKTALEA